jgi:hypothetical protein
MKLYPASISDSEVEATALSFEKLWRDGRKEIRAGFPAEDLRAAGEAIRAYLKAEQQHKIWKNDTYQAQLRQPENSQGWICLSIKRVDHQPIHDWRDLQEIKNAILGPGVEAVELYPAEGRLVDTANQYFLWANPKHLPKFPFGFDEGRVVSEDSFYKSVNRPFA